MRHDALRLPLLLAPHLKAGANLIITDPPPAETSELAAIILVRTIHTFLDGLQCPTPGKIAAQVKEIISKAGLSIVAGVEPFGHRRQLPFRFPAWLHDQRVQTSAVDVRPKLVQLFTLRCASPTSDAEIEQLEGSTLDYRIKVKHGARKVTCPFTGIRRQALG